MDSETVGLGEEVLRLAGEIYPALLEARHSLHRNPELSNMEFKTSDLICGMLDGWKIPYRRHPSGTAVLAWIEGAAGDGPCVGLRADIDALPVSEATGLGFASQNEGVMHACGHDMHTAALLGAGYVLSRVRGSFSGTVKLCFQPAEEVGGGIEQLTEIGMLQDPPVDAFLAAHVCPDTYAGHIHLKEGAQMSASSRFSAVFTGSGGHAASPHQAPDTVLAAAKLICELQVIAARMIDPTEPLSITVGSVWAGEKGRSNIIPKTSGIEGTIRTPKRSVHARVHELIRAAAGAVALMTGAAASVETSDGSDSVMNDPDLTRVFAGAAAGVLGKDKVTVSPSLYLASDNFARFAGFAPSVYFRLGVRAPGQDQLFPLHSTEFAAQDSALFEGTASLAAGAVGFLSEIGSGLLKDREKARP